MGLSREQKLLVQRYKAEGARNAVLAFQFGVSPAYISYVVTVWRNSKKRAQRSKVLPYSGGPYGSYEERWVPRRTTPVLPVAILGSSIPPPTLARLMAGR